MNLQDALLLVREKYLEEQRQVTTGPTSERYLKACKDFPATMNVAHELWARELSKGLP